MGYNRQHTFYFDYELERGEDILEIEVTYSIDEDDLSLESVRYNGRELETTGDEDREILAYASERVNDDMADAEASYGDYLYDMRRDMED